MNNRELVLSALNHLDAGCSREDWIQIGMAAKSAGLSFEDFHNWCKNAENYAGEKDCRSVWDSFKSSGITVRTLFARAKANSWHNSREKNFDPASNRNGTNKLNALDIWERCLDATPAHEYILRKQGRPDGLRYYPSSAPPLIICGKNVANYLVVPCWNNDTLQTLQFISPNKGDGKLNLKEASFNDGYFTVGEPNNLIYICEGLGQGWAIHQASGAAAVICFGAGRMMPVAKLLREKHPNAHLVVVPDRGKESQAAKIAAFVDGQWIELPEDKLSNYDVNDYAQEYGHEELALLLERTKTPEMRYKLLSGIDLLNAPPMHWLVQSIIPAEGLAALYGASGSGKSFLILDMAFSIASGEAYWFGLRVTKTRVIYICLEGELGLGKRINAWSSYFKKPIPTELRFVIQPFNLLSSDVSDLANAIIATRGTNSLVIIDTLNRAAPGADENSSVDMGNIIAAAKQLQSLIGGVVLLVHHTGKDSTKGLRGHSSLYAALDNAIEVIKADNHCEWKVGKSKDDAISNSRIFKLETVPVGLDADGHEITSCVALFQGVENIEKKKLSLGRNQKIALEVINKLLNNSTHTGKEGTPALNKCTTYDEALAHVTDLMPTDTKHRKSSAQNAIGGLVEKRYLGMKGDWLWRM